MQRTGPALEVSASRRLPRHRDTDFLIGLDDSGRGSRRNPPASATRRDADRPASPASSASSGRLVVLNGSARLVNTPLYANPDGRIGHISEQAAQRLLHGQRRLTCPERFTRALAFTGRDIVATTLATGVRLAAGCALMRSCDAETILGLVWVVALLHIGVLGTFASRIGTGSAAPAPVPPPEQGGTGMAVASPVQGPRAATAVPALATPATLATVATESPTDRAARQAREREARRWCIGLAGTALTMPLMVHATDATSGRQTAVLYATNLIMQTCGNWMRDGVVNVFTHGPLPPVSLDMSDPRNFDDHERRVERAKRTALGLNIMGYWMTLAGTGFFDEWVRATHPRWFGPTGDGDLPAFTPWLHSAAWSGAIYILAEGIDQALGQLGANLVHARSGIAHYLAASPASTDAPAPEDFMARGPASRRPARAAPKASRISEILLDSSVRSIEVGAGAGLYWMAKIYANNLHTGPAGFDPRVVAMLQALRAPIALSEARAWTAQRISRAVLPNRLDATDLSVSPNLDPRGRHRAPPGLGVAMMEIPLGHILGAAQAASAARTDGTARTARTASIDEAPDAAQFTTLSPRNQGLPLSPSVADSNWGDERVFIHQARR